MTNEQKNKNLANKVAYIFRKYGKNEVSKAFGFANQSGLSGWDNPLNPKIRPVHLLGLQEYFEIPITIFNDKITYNELDIDRTIEEYKEKLKQQAKEKKIFESLKKHALIPPNIYNREIETSEEIDRVVESYKTEMLSDKEQITNRLFSKDQRLWNNLKGDFYAYMYGSHIFNKDREIKRIKTTFYDDFQVIDQHENRGIVMTGKVQTIIIKDHPNEEHLSFIIFPNKDVTYQTFRFTIVSIQNGTGSGGEEMVNWGFYSREKLTIEEAEKILGQKDKLQLKLELHPCRSISIFMI